MSELLILLFILGSINQFLIKVYTWIFFKIDFIFIGCFLINRASNIHSPKQESCLAMMYYDRLTMTYAFQNRWYMSCRQMFRSKI